MYADDVALPAALLCAVQQLINISCQPGHCSTLSHGGTDRRTPDRCIDPVLHTMRAVSINPHNNEAAGLRDLSEISHLCMSSGSWVLGSSHVWQVRITVALRVTLGWLLNSTMLQLDASLQHITHTLHVRKLTAQLWPTNTTTSYWICFNFIWSFGLQCFDAVGWAAGMASGL